MPHYTVAASALGHSYSRIATASLSCIAPCLHSPLPHRCTRLEPSILQQIWTAAASVSTRSELPGPDRSAERNIGYLRALPAASHLALRQPTIWCIASKLVQGQELEGDQIGHERANRELTRRMGRFAQDPAGLSEWKPVVGQLTG